MTAASISLGLAACGGPSAAPAVPRTSTTTLRPTVRPANCPQLPPEPPAPTPAGGTVRGDADSLVPPGPAVATLCQYTGVDESGGTVVLAEQRVMAGSELDALVAFLDGSSWPAAGDTAVDDCPKWNGATVLAVFAYTTGPDVAVHADIGGCGFASNGTRTVLAYGIGQRLVVLVRS